MKYHLTYDDKTAVCGVLGTPDKFLYHQTGFQAHHAPEHRCEKCAKQAELVKELVGAFPRGLSLHTKKELAQYRTLEKLGLVYTVSLTNRREYSVYLTERGIVECRQPSNPEPNV